MYSSILNDLLGPIDPVPTASVFLTLLQLTVYIIQTYLTESDLPFQK